MIKKDKKELCQVNPSMSFYWFPLYTLVVPLLDTIKPALFFFPLTPGDGPSTAMPSSGTQQLGVFRKQEAAVMNDCCMHGCPRPGLFVFKMDMILPMDCNKAWVCLTDTSDAALWKWTVMCVKDNKRDGVLCAISTQPSTIITLSNAWTKTKTSSTLHTVKKLKYYIKEVQ